MPPSCLFIIDVQRGFVNQWTADIPAKVEDLQHRFDAVAVIRFVNPKGSLFRTLMGWQRFAPGSRDTALAFRPRDDAVVFEKPQYSAVTPQTETYLAERGIGRVHLCGIATDNCVLKTAVDLFERGIEPVVLADFCGSHGGPDYHRAGLLLLPRFIGAAQVVVGVPESELSER